MSISEQVKELRKLANSKEFEPHEPVTYGFYARIKSKLFKAADTIEALSAKLADMERSAEDCGGWILCKDGNNLPEESGYYDVTVESEINGEIIRTTECRCFHKDIKLWAELMEPEFAIDEIVLAWRNRPDPYHETQQIHHPRQRTPQAIPGSERDGKDRIK